MKFTDKINLVEFLTSHDANCATEILEQFTDTILEPLDEEILETFSELKTICSNPMRANIVSLLAQTKLPVCVISTLLNKDQTLISHHLAELKRKNLVVEERFGKFRMYSLNKDKIKVAMKKILRYFRID